MFRAVVVTASLRLRNASRQVCADSRWQFEGMTLVIIVVGVWKQAVWHLSSAKLLYFWLCWNATMFHLARSCSSSVVFFFQKLCCKLRGFKNAEAEFPRAVLSKTDIIHSVREAWLVSLEPRTKCVRLTDNRTIRLQDTVPRFLAARWDSNINFCRLINFCELKLKRILLYPDLLRLLNPSRCSRIHEEKFPQNNRSHE